ncbi:MAG: monovalent cation/H(+) antiporter subunit G [Spirochaeta sp.]|jgi:multicomponent Na+:H+ antiporter subunit G|nr:monovalent cation/H(+) antiporter subunit G [Spirochaeta sp.]
MLELIGAVIVLMGSLFLLLASLGLIRMPDVYNRMQAGTKATTLGSILIFAGAAFIVPAQWPRLVILIVFIFLTNPLSSHALARSAHFQGVPVMLPGRYGSHGTTRDDLAAARAGETLPPAADSAEEASL